MVVISTHARTCCRRTLTAQASQAANQSSSAQDALRILDIVTIINPNVKYIVESVWFEERFPLVYAAVNKHNGHEPLAWGARECSAANRKRYFWANIKHKHPTPEPLDAN